MKTKLRCTVCNVEWPDQKHGWWYNHVTISMSDFCYVHRGAIIEQAMSPDPKIPVGSIAKINPRFVS